MLFPLLLRAKLLHLCPILCDPSGLQPARLLCLRNFPGKNTGMGCHALLQGIFLTQGLNPHLLCLLHWQVGSFTTSGTWEAQLLLQVWVNLAPDEREST